MTEFGNRALIEHREGGNVSLRLPGVKSGDMASRRVKPEVRVLCLQFSPTGRNEFVNYSFYLKQAYLNML